MGAPFAIEPVPKNVSVLRDKVKEKWGENLPCASPQLFVYKLESPESATDEIGIGTNRLSSGDKVPLLTTSVTPLVVVVPFIRSPANITMTLPQALIRARQCATIYHDGLGGNLQKVVECRSCDE